MVNKKGILRIIEASIAILIIFTVIISFSVIRKPRAERDLSERITPLLEEMARNNSLRDEVISQPSQANASILLFLASRIKEENIGYDVKICDIDEVCGLDSYPEDKPSNLYVGSRVISSSFGGGAGAKRINLFLWLRN